MAHVPRLDTRRSQRLAPSERAASDAILRQEVPRRKWYHRMDLGGGIVTPGYPWEGLWDNIRLVRQGIDYAGTCVLDLGSWDGMWAFEAEALGSSLTVATDCMNYWQVPYHQGMNNLFLVREALYSAVIPIWNISAMNLRERLDVMLYSHPLLREGFDVVQHLGLLYHMRDPMYSLAQSRAVLRDNGTLLLETSVHRDDAEPRAYFNAGGNTVYDDFTTWWAPSVPCLKEMLRATLFEVVDEKLYTDNPTKPYSRIALRAVAVPPRPGLAMRYFLDPAYGHGFGEHLIGRLPFDQSMLQTFQAYHDERYPTRPA